MRTNKLIALLLAVMVFIPAIASEKPLANDTVANENQHATRTPTTINYGVKGGFTSALFLISDFYINGTQVGQVQNNYKLGYFASIFMRINFGRHFLQPEVSYNINRSNITFNKPNNNPGNIENILLQEASITSTIHSIDIPVIYGYNIIKEGPYGMAVFGGPKLRYIWKHKSDTEFGNFDQTNIVETLHPFNASFVIGVAVNISNVFFDFRYDLGLHNISKRVDYTPATLENSDVADNAQILFKRRDNVLSFSLGVMF